MGPLQKSKKRKKDLQQGHHYRSQKNSKEKSPSRAKESGALGIQKGAKRGNRAHPRNKREKIRRSKS